MPKKVKLESFRYRFLSEANLYDIKSNDVDLNWEEFLKSLDFQYSKKNVTINSSYKGFKELSFSLSDPLFYNKKNSLDEHEPINNPLRFYDRNKEYNKVFFQKAVNTVAKNAGLKNKIFLKNQDSDRLESERLFHDEWANQERLEDIDVIQRNEAITAPEMRYICKQLGSIKDKKLLDVGCGLGEASVYFAIKGAEVTACDLSEGMLQAAENLASIYNIHIKKHLASSEDLNLKNEKFDIIYAGNLLHHVNIKETLVKLKQHLKDDGVLVTWDPIQYNPAINLYRKLASDVRTPDEHPLRISDLRTFKSIFSKVHTEYFWFSTLFIFILMAIGQKRDPNKERFWKVIVDESEKWSKIYRPLEFADKIILKLFPPLRLLCWNVVIFSRLK